MAELFSPSTPLERAVHAGDYDGTIWLLRPMTPAERKAQRASAVTMQKLIWESYRQPDDVPGPHWGDRPTDGQRRAACAAVFLCGTARDVADLHAVPEHAAMLAREFCPASLDGLADALLKDRPFNIGYVQKLIAAGVVPRPDSDDYAIGLIALPRFLHTVGTLDEVFANDPGLKDVVLKIMDVEGTSEYSLAALDKYNKGITWSATLLARCAAGDYSRDLLLDKTLAALERDWLQFRASWFSRFHVELAPSLEEMRPQVRCYLSLCHSRIAPTVTLALDALRKLEEAGCVQSSEVLEAVRPVLSSRVKAQVGAALKLLDRAVLREPLLASAAAQAVGIGLAHESADVQKQVLIRLRKWGVDEQQCVALRELLPGVAAVNRAALEELIGASPSADRRAGDDVGGLPAPVPSRGYVQPLDESRRLEPIVNGDELVERIAYVLENDKDIDEFERVLAALARATPLSAELQERFAPVMKRVGKVRTPLAAEVARLVTFAHSGARIRGDSPANERGDATAHGYLSERVDELIDVAAQGKRVTPLSAPTHRRGFIDPAVFVERVAEHQSAGVRSSRLEQILGLLRLAPNAGDETRTRARDLQQRASATDRELVHALRYALGDDLEPGKDAALFAAAARIRHPDGDDRALLKKHGDQGPDAARAARYEWRIRRWTYDSSTTAHCSLETIATSQIAWPARDLLAVARHVPGHMGQTSWYARSTFGGSDEGTIAYSATLLPSSLEAFFADGARTIGQNLDWWEAQWQNRAYLHVLLDPSVPLTPMATLLLAVALAGKEPGQTALAVDALVHGHAEARLDLTAFSSALRDLLSTPLVKAARYANSLRAALRIDASLSSALFDVLCRVVECFPEAAPKDAAKLLELLLETKLNTGRALTPPARAALGSLKLSGKSRTVLKTLLS